MPPVMSMPQPICLIENDGRNLVVNKTAKKLLSEISEPVTVVGIVGIYRTGKSFLMNRLAGSNSGFPLGSSIQSKTKGIWMWCVPHPQKPGHVLVLLDTEGLGDVEKGDSKNDSWIFSLTVLLCSALVYNSMGTIDQQAIEQLHYVTELTEMIKVKSTDIWDGTEEYKKFLPSFTWCVRDFTLELERDGKKISEDEYLMMSLELKQGENFENYNLPRECIQNLFHSHKCFVFDRPTSKKNLIRLDELKVSELEEEFVEQAARFYDHMIRRSSVKMLTGGITVTGKVLGNLASLYVDTIQNGSIPCMENAVLALAEIENAGALQDALSTYKCEMDKHVPKYPTLSELEFVNIHLKCLRKATEVFRKRFLNEDEKYLQELKSLEVLEAFMETNRNIEAAILSTNERAAEKERQLAESHNQAMQAKRCRQSVEQLNRDLQHSLNQQSARHQQHINSLTEMMEQNRQRMIQENESLITQRLQAQQSRLSLSHQQTLEEMERRIEETRIQSNQRPSGGGGSCILC